MPKSTNSSSIAMTTEARARSPAVEPLLSDKPREGHHTVTEVAEDNFPPRLLLYSEIPSWQQENEYILTGYRLVSIVPFFKDSSKLSNINSSVRPTSGSVLRSLQSLLYINNETISIYSHLVGCVIFLLLPLHFSQVANDRVPAARYGDILSVSIYTLGVAVCFALSAT